MSAKSLRDAGKPLYATDMTTTTTDYEKAQRLITGYIDAVLPRLSVPMTEKVRAIRERVGAGDDYGAEDVTFEIDEIMSREPEHLTTWDVAVHSWLSPMVERLNCVRQPVIVAPDGQPQYIPPIGGGSQLDFLSRLVTEAADATHVTVED